MGARMLQVVPDNRVNTRQIRAARALLDWTQVDLAAAAQIGIATIRRLETGGPELATRAATMSKIRSALERAGILFVRGDDRASEGVMLRLERTPRPA
jgi:predicted transcriptional regulator